MAIKENRLRSIAMSQHPIQAKQVKRVTVTSKRQISIPKAFAEELNIQGEVIMELVGNKIVLKPTSDNMEDFSENILNDLVDEGYTGEALKQEFKYRKSQLRPAVEAMIADAVEYAERTTVEDLFDEDHNDQ